MIQLPVTLTFASALALALIPLTGWIGVRRDAVGVLRGDGGDAVLFKRSRIHGNLMENAPLFILVLGLVEHRGLSALWLWAAVGSFVLGRLVHFLAYDDRRRAGGMALTTFPGALLGAWALFDVWVR